jgi:Lon protease-like protein
VTSRLPLFPLGTVLFPGVLLPLHVFEQRYRLLVRDLLVAAEEHREFGVIAIREGREVGTDGIRALHPVGCVARLRRVEPYDDGRFDVVGTGSRRFRLAALDESKAYLQGDVDVLDEPDGDDSPRLAALVAAAFAGYRSRLGAEDDGMPDEPRTLSYVVAAGAVLDLTDKQRLLEAPDTATRLRAELALLHRETALLGLLPSLPAIELTRVPASPN